MKILYLIHQFYPEFYTETEKFVLNLSTMMQKLGHRIKVITYSFCEDGFYDQNHDNILLKEFLYKGIPVTAFRHKKIPSHIHTSMEDKDVMQLAHAIMIREAPDLIHVGHAMRVSEFIKAAVLMHIPYVMTLTDFWLICPKFTLLTSKGVLCTGPEMGNACSKLCPELQRDFIVRRLKVAKRILFDAKKVICPSFFLADMFKKELRSLDTIVINHGIQRKPLAQNSIVDKEQNKIIFCYAGSLNYHKGVHLILSAFKKLSSDNIILKIYGSGDKNDSYVNNLRDMAKEDKRIEFCGAFPEDQVGNVLSAVDVLIIPSLWYESYSFILHEAFVWNVPVVASNIGVLAEKIKDGMTGFVFKVDDVDDLLQVLEKIIKNPELLSEFKNNIKNINIPSVEEEAYAYEKEYKKALNNL